MTRKSSSNRGEEQLAKVVLRPRGDDLGDAFPNDWFEAAVLFVTGVAVFGGIAALAYMIEHTS